MIWDEVVESAADMHMGRGRRLTDPRWDEPGFNVWCGYRKEGKHAVAWVSVGYLRKLAASDGYFVRRQELELVPGALHLGAPPREVSLFTVCYGWETSWHPDPTGQRLRDAVAVLDNAGACDDDLVFWDFCCLFQKNNEGERSELETLLFKHAVSGMTRIIASSFIRVIVLPRISASAENQTPLLERGWCVFELFLASYCTRLLYQRGPGNEVIEQTVSQAMDPARLYDVAKLFNSVRFTGNADVSRGVIRMIREHFDAMPAAPEDAVGFARYCEEAGLAWILVATIRDLATRPGPFPRRQELPHGAYILGSPPASCRKFVVSHGWESEVHPSPGGGKMRQLAHALYAAGALDTDVVFFDFMSNTQEAKIGAAGKAAPEYFRYNGAQAPLAGRTVAERRAFDYAMWDMGRLYSFRECCVLVLPTLDGGSTFPGDAGDWGFENTRPYEKRGWCCSEFAIALANKRIVNLGDPAVQSVLHSRRWPKSVVEYADMMDESLPDETRIEFTHKGDRAVVKYNFFKMTMNKHSLLNFPNRPRRLRPF